MITVSWQEALAVLLGFLLSVGAEHLWIVRQWFNGLLPWQKFVLLVVFNVASGIGIYLYYNWGVITWAGLGEAAWLTFVSFITSQGTHMLEKAKVKLLPQ